MYLFVFYIRRSQNNLSYRILFSVTAMAVNTKKKESPHEMMVLIRTSRFLKTRLY